MDLTFFAVRLGKKRMNLSCKLRPIAGTAPAVDDDPDGIAKIGADRDGIHHNGQRSGIQVLIIRIHIFRHNGKAQGKLLR